MSQTIPLLWFMFGMFMGACNDVWVRFLTRIPVTEISCFRFFFSLISLLPFVIRNKNIIKSEHKKIHFVRGVVFFLALTFWELGVKNTQLSTATLIGFSTPFFLLIFSIYPLREKVTIPRILATTISFIMIIGIVDFKNFSFGSSFVVLLFASLLFSISDLLNKKYSTVDNHLTAVLYYNIFAFLVSIPFMIHSFIKPSTIDIIYMFCLGIEANLYSYFLLKAFSTADASFLSPFKYFEFIFSIILGYIFFNEIPTYYNFAVIIVILTVNTLLFKYEKYKNNKKDTK